MIASVKKFMPAAKRGGLWLVVITPLLASSYIVLLATGAFDSAPGSYPDLEVQPDGPTFSILAACLLRYDRPAQGIHRITGSVARSRQPCSSTWLMLNDPSFLVLRKPSQADSARVPRLSESNSHWSV